MIHMHRPSDEMAAACINMMERILFGFFVAIMLVFAMIVWYAIVALGVTTGVTAGVAGLLGARVLCNAPLRQALEAMHLAAYHLPCAACWRRMDTCFRPTPGPTMLELAEAEAKFFRDRASLHWSAGAFRMHTIHSGHSMPPDRSMTATSAESSDVDWSLPRNSGWPE